MAVFNDPLVECLNCHKRQRSDKLEESYAEKHGDKLPENGMADIACPDCGKKIYLFGEGKSEEAAKRHNLPLLAQMPIDPKLAALVDAGKIEEFEGTWLNAAADALEKTRKRAE